MYVLFLQCGIAAARAREWTLIGHYYSLFPFNPDIILAPMA